MRSTYADSATGTLVVNELSTSRLSSDPSP